ncbi:MAG: FtsX-like permease family protein [Lachnospiraceae bacterium]|nr:FtsX-like permease family protein [Lachnospiraceae bacterium]
MKASLMCSLAKLRRRKLPNLFLGICIFITTALSVNALVLFTELDSIFDSAYAQMEGPQLCCLWSNDMFSANVVKQYLDSSPEKFEYQITEKTKTIDYIEKSGTKLSNGILLELPEKPGKDMMSPKISDTSEFTMPGDGEVWVTTKLAAILKLKSGDTFSLQFGDTSVIVKVVKIVTDPVFGSSGTNVYRMWCGYNRLDDFPAAENNAASYLEIRFDEYSHLTEQNFIRETEEYFEMPLGNALYTYDMIKSGYTAVWQMTGAVLCFVSLILVITVVALSVFLIKNDIDEDVKNIGIYKALGMTDTQIFNGYLICYGIIGLAGTVPGSMAGGLFTRKIIAQILKETAISTISFTGIARYQFFTWAVVLLFVLLICFGAIFQVCRLNASYALRKGAWHSDETGAGNRKIPPYNGKVSFEFYYAVRKMQQRKLRYLYMAAVSFLLSSLTVLCAGCLKAVGNIDEEPETWGFIKTDIYVTALENTPVSAILDELKEDPGIDYTYGVNKIYVTYKPAAEKTYRSITTELYELPWHEKINDRALYGRRPLSENEIGVGLGLARTYGFEVGDKIELLVNGQRKEYEITEIFQTLSNSGNVFRMVTDNLDEFVKADGHYGDYMLVLRNSSDKWEYAKELANRYDGKFAFIASKSNGESFTGVLAPAAGMILTVLMVIIVLITTTLTFLLIKREQNLIGLLKAIGLTSRQTLKIYLYRNCLPAILGSAAGVAAGIFIIPALLSPYAKRLGLTEFPFAGSPAGTLTGFLLAPVCIFLATCTILKIINTISIKQLAAE